MRIKYQAISSGIKYGHYGFRNLTPYSLASIVSETNITKSRRGDEYPISNKQKEG